MPLVAALTMVAAARVGRLKWLTSYAGSLVGLQEPEPGWLLCNGTVLSNVDPYTALVAMLGSKFGSAGKLPTIIDGVTPLPKGATFATVGAAAGEKAHALTLAELPSHLHSTTFLGSNRQISGTTTGYGYETFQASQGLDRDYFDVSTSGGSMGGGAHDNMPPGIVVGAVVVRYR